MTDFFGYSPQLPEPQLSNVRYFRNRRETVARWRFHIEDSITEYLNPATDRWERCDRTLDDLVKDKRTIEVTK